MIKMIMLIPIIFSLIAITGCNQNSSISINSNNERGESDSMDIMNQDSENIAIEDPLDSKTIKAEYRRISAEEAKEMLDTNTEAILLDVRTEEEFSMKRISGAILLPDYEVAYMAEEMFLDKDALILIYCRSGNRSMRVANTLIEMGYTNVYDFGGINSWPYDTEKD